MWCSLGWHAMPAAGAAVGVAPAIANVGRHDSQPPTRRRTAVPRGQRHRGRDRLAANLLTEGNVRWVAFGVAYDTAAPDQTAGPEHNHPRYRRTTALAPAMRAPANTVDLTRAAISPVRGIHLSGADVS